MNSYAKFGGAARRRFPAIFEKLMGGTYVPPGRARANAPSLHARNNAWRSMGAAATAAAVAATVTADVAGAATVDAATAAGVVLLLALGPVAFTVPAVDQPLSNSNSYIPL